MADCLKFKIFRVKPSRPFLMGNTEPISAIEFLALDAADTVDVQYVITILTDRIQEQSIVDGHELHIAQLKVRRLMHFV